MIVYYAIMFGLSILLGVWYAFRWHKHFDVNFTLIFTLVPVACLGYLLYNLSKSLDAAIVSQQIVYIGGNAGNGFLPIRLFARPEIHILKFHI